MRYEAPEGKVYHRIGDTEGNYAIAITLPQDNIDDYELVDKPILVDEELEKAKEDKIDKIVAISKKISIAGTDFTYNDVTSHYSLTDFDIACIMARGSLAQQGKTVSWHSDGCGCRLYTPDEFVKLYVTVDLFLFHHSTYSNELKHQVEDMTDIDSIKAVKYGETELTEERQANYDMLYANELVTLGVPTT